MRITKAEFEKIMDRVKHVFGDEGTVNVEELIEYIESEAELAIRSN
jgi:hypothetical protein